MPWEVGRGSEAEFVPESYCAFIAGRYIWSNVFSRGFSDIP